jgi:nucleoid DNA-binding protein
MPVTNQEFIQKLATKMNTTEEEASGWVAAFTQTMFDIFKSGEGVSIDGLGEFDIMPGDDKPNLDSISLN